jgi:hypothetical protein
MGLVGLEHLSVLILRSVEGSTISCICDSVPLCNESEREGLTLDSL